MRRIRVDNLGGRAVRVMDLVAHKLVSTPAAARLAGRLGVEPSEAGPPLRFQPGFEVARIQGADDVAAYAAGVLDDKHAPRAEHGVGCSVDMPEQLRILIKRGGVVAAGAGRQTDPVQVVEVARPNAADFSHSLLLAPCHITLAEQETAMQADYVII